jgi:hypothetical protein
LHISAHYSYKAITNDEEEEEEEEEERRRVDFICQGACAVASIAAFENYCIIWPKGRQICGLACKK